MKCSDTRRCLQVCELLSGGDMDGAATLFSYDGVFEDRSQQVNELVARAGIHQSGVSRHLRILHDAGFVSMRPEGQRRLYSLKPEPFRALDRWLAQYRDLWEKRLDRLEEALEKKRKRSKTPHQEQDT
jgi:DNA-binding transcriptional ArsR family regulator